MCPTLSAIPVCSTGIGLQYNVVYVCTIYTDSIHVQYMYEHEREYERFPGKQSRCSLCREHLRSLQTQQWKSELEQFLLKYTEIEVSCVCKACECSI